MLWYSVDFPEPSTGIPCRFCWDSAEEIISMQPSPPALKDEMASCWKQAQTACAAWGLHSCGSKREAERIIRSVSPAVWEYLRHQRQKELWTATL